MTEASKTTLDLTRRDKELLLWQLLVDMGGEISTVPALDKPNRRVLYVEDERGITMIADGDMDDDIGFPTAADVLGIFNE